MLTSNKHLLIIFYPSWLASCAYDSSFSETLCLNVRYWLTFCPVESDYTVVFFAAGVRHAPSWNWVWKAYRSLSRKYRKNLKKLVRFCSDTHLYLLSPPCFSLASAACTKCYRRVWHRFSLNWRLHSCWFTASHCDTTQQRQLHCNTGVSYLCPPP